MPRVVFPSSPAADWTRGLVKADHFEDNQSFGGSDLWIANTEWSFEVEAGTLGRGGFCWFYVGSMAVPSNVSCYVSVVGGGRVLAVLPFTVKILTDGTIKVVGYADMSEIVVMPGGVSVRLTLILRFSESTGGNVYSGAHFYHIRR